MTTHPVVAATLPWATSAGSYRLTVMVKATFQLRHGEPAKLTEPYPFFSDVHHDDNPGCSLSVATDWVPRKRNAEVLFLGNAYAPYGEHVPRRTVRLSIATPHGPLVDKSLLVLGERLRNKKTGMTTRPEPFARVPLRYELTFGGAASPHNPVGVGVDANDVRLPAIGLPMDARQVAGFGPLSPTWRPRARLLGTFDPKALNGLLPTIPHDFEFAFFNAAPEDQQTGVLSGHEEILLSGLHLTLPEVRTRLPGLRATAKLAIAGDERAVPLVADTLWISGDTLRACLTFRGDLEVTKEIAEGLVPVKLTAGLVTADPPGASKPPTRPSIAGPRLENPMAASVVRGAPALRPQGVPHESPPTLAIAANTQLPPAPSIALKSTQRGPEVVAAADMIRPRAAPSAFKSTQRLLPSQGPSKGPAAIAAPVVHAPRIADAQPQAKFTTTIDDSSVVPFAFASVDAPPMAALAPTGPSLFKMTVSAPSSRPWLSSVGETHQPEEVAAQRPIEAFRRSAPGLAGFVPPEQLAPPGTYPEPPAAFAADEETDSQQRISLMPLSEERVFDESAYDGKFVVPAREGDPLPLVNATRFVAFTMPWQLRPPQDARVIIVKATFDLVANAPATLADEQMLPSGDTHYDDDENASLRYGSDFVPFKPKADVVVVGTMRPGGEGNVGVVTFSLGSLHKKLAVFGTRLWGSFGASTPEKFDAIPMRWEHALGGPLSPDNPIGIGFKTGIAAPHLEDPEELLRGPGTVVPPACFAPMHASWRPRASKIGTYGKKWLETRWPYLPDDFDWAYFNAAAPAMQIAYPEGDERWTLGGFGGPPIGGRLPALRPRAFVMRTEEQGGELVEVLLRLDTLWFDADAKKMVLVYRGLVETIDDIGSDLSLVFLTRDRESKAPLTLEGARARLHGELAARDLLRGSKESRAAVAIEAENETTRLSLSEVYAKMGAKLDVAAAERRAPVPIVSSAAKPDFKQRMTVPTRAAPATMKATMADVTPPVFLGARDLGAPAAAAAPALLSPMQAALAPPPAATQKETLLAELAAGGSLVGRDLTGVDLSGADLSGVDLTKAILASAKLRGAKLEGAKLVSATLTDVDAEDASFATADLTSADLSRARLDRADLSGTKLHDAVLDGVHAHSARFPASTGERTSFIGASLVSANFEGASLASADFTGATVEAARFARAELPDLRLIDAQGMDVVFDEAQLPRARATGAKLARPSFRGVKADASVWEKADLTDAKFERASLHGALFVRTILDNANFSHVEAVDACFRRASLRSAKMLKANLMRATFESADLSSADLRGANLYQAETWKARLTHARTDLAIVAGSKLEA